MAPADFVNKAESRGAIKWKSAIKCKPDTGKKRSMSLGTWLEHLEVASIKTKKPKQKQGTKQGTKSNGAVSTTRKFPRKVELERRLQAALGNGNFPVAECDEVTEIPAKMRSTKSTACRRVIHLTQMATANFQKHLQGVTHLHPARLLGQLTTLPSSVQQ